MRQINYLPKKVKYSNCNSLPLPSPKNKLFVVHHNKQMKVSIRKTTIYKISDERNDPSTTELFFLIPDLNCEVKDMEDYSYPQDFLSDEEEMMLFNQPIITTHSLHKI
jgi:hypothetical protein